MVKTKLRLVLLSSLAFGLGGLIAAYLGDFMLFGFGLMGLLGGLALGYSLGLSIPSVIKIALFGGVGLFLGFIIPFFVMLTMWEPPMKFLLTGLLGGGVGGIILGLSFNSKISVWKLGLGGAIGFGCGMLLLDFFATPCVLALTGILGGAAIGISLQTLQIKK